METSIPRKDVGCIGKCTSGLTIEQLNRITKTIKKTLTHPQGRRILREYLKQGHRRDDLECLDFYEKCCDYIDKEQNYHNSVKTPTLDFLREDVNKAMLIAVNLGGVSEIDKAMLEKFHDVLTRPPCRDSMLSVLEETKILLMNHLQYAHRGFRSYVLLPCPASK